MCNPKVIQITKQKIKRKKNRNRAKQTNPNKMTILKKAQHILLKTQTRLFVQSAALNNRAEEQYALNAQQVLLILIKIKRIKKKPILVTMTQISGFVLNAKKATKPMFAGIAE